jgi:predicted nucleic acid-binding protein
MKGKFNLDKKFDQPTNNCLISEITLAELMFGVENSEKPDRKHLERQNIIPCEHKAVIS